MTAYYPVLWNVSTAKGTEQRIVLDGVVQEIDIPTGLVLFQWDSLDHVPVTASYQPCRERRPPVGLLPPELRPADRNGDVIISARDTWAVYEFATRRARSCGRLGGKRRASRWAPTLVRLPARRAACSPRRPHDPLFDDGGGPPRVHKQARGLTLRLDYPRT